MTEIDEDYQAWDAYPESRWIFNKLELSLKLGYNAGPACVPVKEAGKYIVRPIYNLYGMGVGTSIKYLDPVAYVSFASVYMNFREEKDFVQFVDRIDVFKKR